MPNLILINLQYQLMQCSIVQCPPPPQKKIEICISTYDTLVLMTKSSSRARQPLSRVNLIDFTMPTNLFCCFSRYQAPINNVAPSFCISTTRNTQFLDSDEEFFFWGGGAGLQPPSPPPGPVRVCRKHRLDTMQYGLSRANVAVNVRLI